ncbi:MAG: WecB/TagA/CpsF family glycosyltransferase [Lentisphaerae bacterium]|nr:WecB/TagA/CpsF family glycosyltransferase [Lentisphaerota bacterium]
MSKEPENKSNPQNSIPRFSVLGVQLSGLKIEDAVRRIVDATSSEQKHYVCVFAVDSLLKSIDHPNLLEIANNSYMTLCDGMPLVWIGKKIAKLDMNRCYGPDVMIKTIEMGCKANIKHFFYGCDCEDTYRKLEANLKTKFPDIKIAGHYIPPFRDLTAQEVDYVAQQINDSGADCVWVGIGTPRQDFWIQQFRPLISTPVLLSVGAAFIFHAGTVPQAPRWMMRCGLEWLFRLMAEPHRLWRRYIIGNPRFIWLIIKQYITKKPAPLGKVLKNTES